MQRIVYLRRYCSSHDYYVTRGGDDIGCAIDVCSSYASAYYCCHVALPAICAVRLSNIVEAQACHQWRGKRTSEMAAIDAE